MPLPEAAPEHVGRVLHAADLEEQTVVVVFPPGRDEAFTMWVERVALDIHLVAFYSGELKWTVVNAVLPDGRIVDDRGREVVVREWLGPI